jgi:hypothetical protein
MFGLVCGIVLLAWGTWCIIAAFQKRKAQVFALPSDEFLPKKILGKYYDPVMNVLYGVICLAFGVLLVFT